VLGRKRRPGQKGRAVEKRIKQREQLPEKGGGSFGKANFVGRNSGKKKKTGGGGGGGRILGENPVGEPERRTGRCRERGARLAARPKKEKTPMGIGRPGQKGEKVDEGKFSRVGT